MRRQKTITTALVIPPSTHLPQSGVQGFAPSSPLYRKDNDEHGQQRKHHQPEKHLVSQGSNAVHGR